MACSSRPEIRLVKSRGVDFYSYRTFVLVDPVSMDESLDTTLVNSRLRKAARQEIERRNYIYDERNPDMRVNVDCRPGTLSVDIIDVRRNELAWQGVAEGHIKCIDEPGAAVDSIVGDLFVAFPQNFTGRTAGDGP